MPMRDTDTILGAPRGSAEEALDFAHDIGAKRLEQVERYIREVYELAPRIDVDPAIVVAQSALETNNWRDEKWNRKLNAAGIGVTDDLDHGFGWDNGEASARGQIVHLWLYAKGTSLPRQLADFKALDPRWEAAVEAGFAGGSPTLASLGGRWASVEDYGQRIARRSRDVFANLPNQRPPSPAPAPVPPSLPIVQSFIPSGKPNRRGQTFDTQELFITVHETNNPNSNTEGEGNFFRGGGGAKKVAVHFVVDEDRAVQLLPLDERGKHSDEGGPGDRTSVAIETCVATRMDFAKVRRNVAQLIARIAAGDGAIDWGNGSSQERFSLARVRMHNDWSPRNPCPRHIRKEKFWSTFLNLVSEAAAGHTAAPAPDRAWKERQFGGKTVRRIIDGQEQEHVIAYNPDGQISQLWERLSGEAGVWPRFSQYRQLEARREYWIFEDGFTVWRPNSTRPVRLPKGTSDGEMPGVDASWKRNRFSRRQIHRTVDGQPQDIMFGYDAEDPIAQLWEQRGAETGRWPRFAGYQEGAEGREFWTFVGGFTVTRTNASGPAMPLMGAEAAAIDESWKRERFGTKTVHRILGNTRQRFVIAYDPNGAVSRLWEQRGAETGSWPPFARYMQDPNRQEFWIFGDGFTVWRPLARSNEPVHVLTEE